MSGQQYVAPEGQPLMGSVTVQDPPGTKRLSSAVVGGVQHDGMLLAPQISASVKTPSPFSSPPLSSGPSGLGIMPPSMGLPSHPSHGTSPPSHGFSEEPQPASSVGVVMGALLVEVLVKVTGSLMVKELVKFDGTLKVREPVNVNGSRMVEVVDGTEVDVKMGGVGPKVGVGIPDGKVLLLPVGYRGLDDG